MARKHFRDTLCAMLGAGEPADPHKAARYRWLRETTAAWQEAHCRLNEAWDRALARLPDDISDEELEALELPDPPEQAEVDALWEQLNDVIQKDVWPREMYFKCI